MAKRVGLTLVERAYDALMPNPPGVADFAGVKRIALGLIDPHPDQPRRGPLPDVPELAAHVARYGLLQPIVVAPAGGRYQLVAGARRLAAFRYLRDRDGTGGAAPSNWDDIPAFVRDTDTRDRLLLALAENLARHDLSDADTLLAVRTLHDMYAWPATEIAGRIGTSIGWISQILGVARDPELADLVQGGRLTVAKAHEIRTAKTPGARAAALAVGLHGGSQPAIRQAKRVTDLGYANPPPAAAIGAVDAAPPTAPTDRPGVDLPSPGGGGSGADGRTADLRYLNSVVPSDAESPAAPGGADERDERDGAQARPAPVATTAPVAGARDLAEVARELGLTGHFVDLESTPLFAVGLRNGLATFDAEAMMRAMREDLRRLEGLVRAAQLERRERHVGA